MTATISKPSKALPDAPAFLVGVTGHIDLHEDDIPRLKERIRLLFHWLKPAPLVIDRPLAPAEVLKVEKEREQKIAENLAALVSLLPNTTGPDANPRHPKQPYLDALKHWPRLDNTPVIVMSSLAPGADTLVAEVALEPEFVDAGFIVIAPLPLPPAEYLKSSSFHRTGSTAQQVQQRQDAFNRLLGLIPEENRFVVATAEDLERSHHEIEQKYQLAVSDKPAESDTARQERHLRYRAAGEYMANHAHLLIAICDDEIDNDTDAAQSASAAKGGGVGTAGVVAARRRGPTVGLAPTNHYLIMPHGGPALHIHARRENHSEPPKNCTWRFLQARSALPPGKRPSDHLPDNDAAWQKYALTLMARVASNLQQFNEEPRASDDATHKEMCKRLTFSVEKNEKTCFAGELRSHNAQLFRSLKRLAALRRGSSDVAIRLAQESDRTIFWLFGCTLLAALLWESFTHWHPQSEELASDGKVAADLHAAGPQDSTAEAKDPTHKHGAQALVGGLSIILAVAAIGWFWIRRGRQFEEHSHDYRAISEGARVQFYWQLAGLGKSTSSHYLNRQRSELDWIRGAIRSMSLPYERARECFGKLAPEQQIAALRCVLHAWIEEQYEYFKVKSHQNESQLHRFHHLGKLLALTGVALAVVLIGDTIVAAIFSTGHPASMKSPITWMKSPVGFRWLVALDILIALVWPAIVWAMYYQHRPKHQGHRPKKSGRFEAVLDSFLAWYLPSGHDSSDLQDSDPSPNKLFKDFLFYLPSMAILAFTSMVVIIYATEHWLALPPTHDLQIIIAGALLIFGAMSVAWAERHSCSELAYRYRAMLSLFENARAQIAGQIEQLQQLPADSADYARLLDGIQRAIRELGIEALDENAEWLILHRARPLEPVMAG